MATADAADDGYAANDSAAVHFASTTRSTSACCSHRAASASKVSYLRRSVTLLRTAASRRSARRSRSRSATPRACCAAHIHDGDACELLTPQRARCALPALSRGSNSTWTTARNSPSRVPTMSGSPCTRPATRPHNDTLTRAILVRPYNDIAVSGDVDLTLLYGRRDPRGDLRRDVPGGARSAVRASWRRHYLPGMRVAMHSRRHRRLPGGRQYGRQLRLRQSGGGQRIRR